MRYLFALLLMFSSLAAEAKPYHDYNKHSRTSKKSFVHHQKKNHHYKSKHHDYRSKDDHSQHEDKYSWKKNQNSY
jgi:hypothetical protein